MGASCILLIVFNMSSRGSRRVATIALGLQPAVLSPVTCNCFMSTEEFSYFPVFNNSLRTPDVLLPTATEKYPVRPPIFFTS